MYYALTFAETGSNRFGRDFGTVNTYDDWFLAPTERPSFQPPSFDIQTISVPGRDGLIDVTTSLKRYPTYGNRTGSLEFLIHPDSPYTWHETYAKVSNYLNGQRKRVSLEDDPAYWYEGRFWLDKFGTGEHYSTITIQYNLDPYKKSKWTTTERWEWDPFNFESGVILRDFYLYLDVSSNDGLDPTDGYKQVFNSLAINERYRQEAIGRMTVCPKLTVNSYDQNGMDIWFENEELDIYYTTHMNDGDTTDPNIIFSMQHSNNGVRLAASGWGQLSIDFYIGSL